MEIDVWMCMRRERDMFGCVCGERYRDRYVEKEIGIGMWR